MCQFGLKLCELCRTFENSHTFGRHNEHNFRSNRQALARLLCPNWHISTARPLHFEIMHRSEATGHWNTVRANFQNCTRLTALNSYNFDNSHTFGRHNEHNFRSNRRALARRLRPNWYISTARPSHFEIMGRWEGGGH